MEENLLIIRVACIGGSVNNKDSVESNREDRMENKITNLKELARASSRLLRMEVILNENYQYAPYFYLFVKQCTAVWEVSYVRKKYYLKRKLGKIICRGKNPQKIYNVIKAIYECENGN